VYDLVFYLIIIEFKISPSALESKTEQAS